MTSCVISIFPKNRPKFWHLVLVNMIYWIQELKLHSIVIFEWDDLLIRFLTMEDEFVYCNNILGLPKEIGLSYYNSDEWRLFIDSSKRSLKRVLLHKGNKFACVSIGHSVVVKEHYLNVKMALNKLSCNEHNWAICVDFKMVNFL